jgi:hypothetical protein
MTRNTRRRCVFTFLLATAALAIFSGDARAQWGMDGGFFGMRTVPSPSESINAQALVQAGRATMGPVSNNVYANNPNAFFNRIRDNGLSSHYSLNSRRSPGLPTARRRSASTSQASNEPPPAETPALARPLVPIGSFFDAARKLIWPSDSPVTGALREKRDVSDQACLVVAELVEKYRSAPITSVSDARHKLLEYGQPALREVRAHTTPRIAETFHLFMLSLYDSLAQAAEAPVASATTNSAP